MELPQSFTGWLTINRECNLRCKWCYTQMIGFKKEYIHKDIVRQAIELYKGLPLQNIILIGGEPTLHPYLVDIVRMIKNAGLGPLLITNGIKLADEDFLDELLDAGVKAITISLKAANEEQYEQFTGIKSFTQVMRAVKNISQRKVLHKISVTICKNLFEDFENLIEVIDESGTKSFSLDMERPIIINNRIVDDGIATPREMADFICGIYPKLLNCKTRFTIKFSIPLCLFSESFVQALVENNQAISGCQIFNGSGIIIDPKGRLLPCNHFCDNPLGRLGDDFTTTEEYLKFRERADVADFYKRISSCPHPQCVDCKYWKYCGSGCKVHWLCRRVDELIGNFRKKEAVE